MIEQALEEAKCVVVVWSQNSIQSEWVFNEAEEGKVCQMLVPVLIDNVRPPLGFRHIHAVRLINWQGDASHSEFSMLIESIETAIGQAKQVCEVIWQSPPSNEMPVAEVAKPMPKPVAENAAVNGFVNDLNGVKLEMVYVPGGKFTMGSDLRDREKPLHEVIVPSFYIGKFQITQAQWKAVMGDKLKPGFEGDDNLPMESVSWKEAKEFCQKLQQLTKKAYRLPSEAEWEYACRAKTIGDHAGNLDEMAWYRSNSDRKTHPVGKKKPNAFGLYDMHGNVWEWCEDVWHDSYQKAPTDGSAWLDDGDSCRRVLRGGTYNAPEDHCRSAYRFGFDSNDGGGDIGFRVAVSARTQ